LVHAWKQVMDEEMDALVSRGTWSWFQHLQMMWNVVWSTP